MISSDQIITEKLNSVVVVINVRLFMKIFMSGHITLVDQLCLKFFSKQVSHHNYIKMTHGTNAEDDFGYEEYEMFTDSFDENDNNAPPVPPQNQQPPRRRLIDDQQQPAPRKRLYAHPDGYGGVELNSEPSDNPENEWVAYCYVSDNDDDDEISNFPYADDGPDYDSPEYEYDYAYDYAFEFNHSEIGSDEDFERVDA